MLHAMWETLFLVLLPFGLLVWFCWQFVERFFSKNPATASVVSYLLRSFFG